MSRDLMLMDLFNPFNFDKEFYKFTRDEKDMHPYSIVSGKDKITMVHNVLGLDKKDVKINKKVENGVTLIEISGTTEDELTGKKYSINSRFSIDDNQVDLSKATSSMKNGLLYISLPLKKQEKKLDKGFIEIQ